MTHQDALGAQIMQEVKRYDDGMGCTRRQLVDNILVLISQTARASVAAPPPRELYSELIHVAAELVRADGFLSPCSEDLAPKLKRADLLKIAERQDERLKDWAMRIRRVADELSAPSPVAAPVDAETPVRCVHCGATEHSYQQDWDHPFESLAVAAPSSGSSIKAATARHYFCSCGGALTAEEYIEHYFERGHDHGEPELLIRAAAAELQSKGLLWSNQAAMELGGEPFSEEEQIAEVTAILSKHVGAAAGGKQWLPIETAPKDGRTLLLGYTNPSGNWRTVRGQWFTDEEIGEWDNADDFEAWWYETSEENDEPPNCWLINPTHWMPLPSAPAATPTSKQT